MIRLDLADIQGNIHRPYGRFGFPYSRHLFFHIENAAAGRAFVEAIRPRITTAEPWDTDERADGTPYTKKPAITLNIAFTFMGLHALDLPTQTLRLLPDEFIDGMACRADILGDAGPSAPGTWEPVWHAGPAVHVWVSLNARVNPDGSARPELDEWTQWLLGLAIDGVKLVPGHGADGGGDWQDSKALMEPLGPNGEMMAIPKEHFGFTDGISDPVFSGQFDPDDEAVWVVGSGKLADGPYKEDSSWSALAAGEFILGQVDEGQEVPVATEPAGFSRNGTFMAYRKLEQDVAAWDAEMLRQAAVWKKVTGCTDDTEAEETVRAKIVGRWRSGIPLLVAPTWQDQCTLEKEYADCIEIALRKPRGSEEKKRLDKYLRLLTSFRYATDPTGANCPLGAHIRRANPRDMLDPRVYTSDPAGGTGDPKVGTADAKAGEPQAASTLTNRRRILRRGLPYEEKGRKGVVFMAICSSLFRQFEFIQQQWMNYGLDFEAGNDTCPLIGNREQPTKHVIPAGAANAIPVIAADLPAFVTTRGGDYFFVPGLNAIRMIAMGTIDPT